MKSNIKESTYFDINNRKYIGSKNRLLDFLEKTILRNTSNEIGVFADIFSGTGVVANHFRKFSKQVISNDILYSNFIINKVFLNSNRRNVRVKKIEKMIKSLNELKPVDGYCYRNFGDTYFTKENASRVDAIRERIEELKNQEQISTQEYYVLLTSLLFAIDKVANTVGQYDAFLKHIGDEPYNKSGKHLVDGSVYKKIELKMPLINFDGNNKVFNEDANILIKKIQCDTLYLDPPYNHRQYIDCYHVLENIMVWKKPKVYGKTKKFKRDYLKSKYSQHRYATNAFEDLINNAKCKHIFLSYNNEGIIPDSEIIRILKNKGEVKNFKIKYNIFGNGAGRAKKRFITERLFYCKVKGEL
jgi:adenine-specific DNA-methyltransferase